MFSDFHEWFARQPDIRPATVLHDELAIYRLELHLNELRRAFRTTDDYLQTGDALGLMELYGRT